MTDLLHKKARFKENLLSGGIWAFVGKIGTVLASLIANAILARLLSPDEMGAYFLTFSLVTLCTLIAQLGLNQTVVRLVAESIGLGQIEKARETVKGVFTYASIGIVIVATVIGVGGGKYAAMYLFHSSYMEKVIPLAVLWIVVLSYQGLIAESFRGFSDIRLATVLGGLVTSVLFVTFLSWQWFTFGHSQLSLIIIFAISAVSINSTFGGCLLKRKLLSLNKKYKPEWNRIFSITMPLLATNITLFMVNYVDLWVLGIHSSQDEVAIYGAVSRLVATIALPLMIVNAVVPPVIAGMYVQKRNKRLENILRVSAVLATIPAILTVFCFIFFGETILSLLFGSYYSQGLITLVFLSVGRLANVWAGSCGLTLILTGHQKTMMVITFFSATLLVTGASLMAGKYGANGVAIISCVTMIIQNFLMLIFSRMHTGIWTHASFNPILIKRVLYKNDFEVK